MTRNLILAVTALAVCITGCRSPRIDVTIENHTGAPVELLEVAYPSASFGVGRLDTDAVYRYRIQIRGSGSIHLQYNEPVMHLQRQISGPTLTENQSGALRIQLRPGGRADFR
ncbi:MAG: hypothetical protein P4L40_19980 [Terracidiphilus sp.]|nr:hypothetical protein [Terracidiphilus sp.]